MKKSKNTHSNCFKIIIYRAFYFPFNVRRPTKKSCDEPNLSLVLETS